jgi:hypothetical protein
VGRVVSATPTVRAQTWQEGSRCCTAASRYRLKLGAEEQLLAFEQEVREAQLPELIAEFTLCMDADPNSYFEVVVFESCKAYRAVAESPEQDTRYRKLLALLKCFPSKRICSCRLEIIWRSGKPLRFHQTIEVLFLTGPRVAC